jgi:hypothetical protein
LLFVAGSGIIRSLQIESPNSKAICKMAGRGRGRGLTLPAWMTAGEGEANEVETTVNCKL